MEPLERFALHYLANEQFCSTAELILFVQLQLGCTADAGTAMVAEFLAAWDARGWTGATGEDHGAHIHLLDQAFHDLPWLAARPNNG